MLPLRAAAALDTRRACYARDVIAASIIRRVSPLCGALRAYVDATRAARDAAYMLIL